MFKVGVCYPNGKKEITYLTHRSMLHIKYLIHDNNKRGIRTLILLKD
jgi:hypothetical protein